MNLEQKILELKSTFFNLISRTEITFLKDLDNRITINKNGKFCYYECLELDTNNIWKFLVKLEDNRIYSIIPLISANNKPNEPYITLSQSFLISKNSSPLLISRFIYDKIILAGKLYNISEFKEFNIIFKYKAIEIQFEDKNKFV
jgi:hypothetical protein